MTSPRVTIVGLGRESLSDDAVGLRMVEALAKRSWPDLDVVCVATQDPLSILADAELLERDLLVFLDASPDDSDHSCGSCVKIDLSDPCARILYRGSLGTHGIGLDTVLRLGDELGCLPHGVWVYLVFANCFERSLRMTPELSAQIDSLVDQVAGDLKTWTEEASCTS